MKTAIKKFKDIRVGERVTHYRTRPDKIWEDISDDNGEGLVVDETRAFPNTYWSAPEWEWQVVDLEPEFNEHGEVAL